MLRLSGSRFHDPMPILRRPGTGGDSG